MPDVTIRLRPRRTAPLPTVAWYLPGDSLSDWIDEIVTWPVAHSAIDLVLIRDAIRGAVAGVLAIPPSADFRASGSCVAFGKSGNSVYLPTDAELYPFPTTTELGELFTDDYIYVWLPGRALTVAEPTDVVRVSDLFDLPTLEPTNWDRATPGLAFPSRLSAIYPIEEILADDIIQDGRGDIGERGDEITKLPKRPGEPSDGVMGKVGRGAATGLGYTLLGLSKLISRRPAGSGSGASSGHAGSSGGVGFGWADAALNHLSGAANRMLGGVSRAIEEMRYKEVGRLMNMLDSDPDQGLRFAIPMGNSGGVHRGLSLPGSKLMSRSTNFNLGNLGGGGPADFWDMPWEYQQRLLAKYRELAAREIRLGRHRRAAYVYAHLLDDLTSAASALEQGNHFREAAVLYRDRLNNPDAAASCLERGELWTEAIEAYRELGKREKAGDLLAQIGQQQAADEEYLTVASECLEKQDFLGAARIYEEKLRDAESALEKLDAGWPGSSQAKLCVEAGFALRGKQGWHDGARDRAQGLYDDAEGLSRYADIAELLTNVFERYPDANVSSDAADFSRRLIANRMRDASRSETQRLTMALARLSPEDKLLARDGWRFVTGERGSLSPQGPPVRPERKRTRELRQVGKTVSVRSGAKEQWHSAIPMGELLLLAGTCNSRVVLGCSWPSDQFNIQRSLWKEVVIEQQSRIMLQGKRSPLQIVATTGQHLPEKQTGLHPAFESLTLSAGTPAGIATAYGLTQGATGHIWTIESRDDPVLVCLDANGRVVSTLPLPALDIDLGEIAHPIPMQATSDRVVLGMGRAMVVVRGNQVETSQEFQRPIVSIGGGGANSSQRYSAQRIVVGLEHGAALVRLGSQLSVESFDSELESPTVAMLGSGIIVAADSHQVVVYEPNKNQRIVEKTPVERCRAKHDLGVPIAILAGVEVNQLRLVTERGAVCSYQF